MKLCCITCGTPIPVVAAHGLDCLACYQKKELAIAAQEDDGTIFHALEDENDE